MTSKRCTKITHRKISDQFFFYEVYSIELMRQSKCALMAFDSLCLSSRSNDKEQAFYSLQNFFLATGNISKILWPPITKGCKQCAEYRSARGELLRKHFSVTKESYLCSRLFRDHVEHFDERLDVWLESNDGRIFRDLSIAPRAKLNFPAPVLRSIDPETFTVTFSNMECNLLPLKGAVVELMHKLEQEEIVSSVFSMD